MPSENPPWFLVADDDNDDFELLESFLRSTYPDFEVIRRGDGQDLLALLEQAAAGELAGVQSFPKAIFLDLEMPRLNGLDTLRALRRRLGWRRIPVILLSGRKDEALTHEALRSGASAYLHKNECFAGSGPSPLVSCLAALIRREVPVLRLDWRPAPPLEGVFLNRGRR